MDYKALNVVIVHDYFPIPVVDELFNELTGVTIFSKIDLCVGYHQIQIHLPDVEKMKFHTHNRISNSSLYHLDYPTLRRPFRL